MKGDFMQMEYENNTFDFVYAIEATVHAPTLEGVYAEIYRTLKPGGVFGVYEWLTTDKYDPTNPVHREIHHGIEQYVLLLRNPRSKTNSSVAVMAFPTWLVSRTLSRLSRASASSSCTTRISLPATTRSHGTTLLLET